MKLMKKYYMTQKNITLYKLIFDMTTYYKIYRFHEHILQKSILYKTCRMAICIITLDLKTYYNITIKNILRINNIKISHPYNYNYSTNI